MEITILKNKNMDDYKTWLIWTCERSEFDWEYTEEEHCYIIEGEIKVSNHMKILSISKGDYVIFPKGLKCKWKVLRDVRKYYTFK